MDICAAQKEDLGVLCQYDKHIAKDELVSCISRNRIYIAKEEGKFIGWLRYNLFWDNTPFLNMVYILGDDRGKGFGRQLVEHWEKQMKLLGYECVMTSTASDEYAQHFYHRLGYQTVGGFFYQSDPYELILMKSLEGKGL